MDSPSFSITHPELYTVAKNALVFFAPLGILYLGAVAIGVKDGVSLHDFVPSTEVIGAMVLYVLNVSLDFLRKFVPDNSSR